MAAYGSATATTRRRIIAGMAIPLLPLMIAAPVFKRLEAGRRTRGRARMLTGLVVAAVSSSSASRSSRTTRGFGPAIWPAMVPYVLAPLAALGFRWLQAPSMKGRRVMDQIDGFKQYLSVAEEDRLEFLNPPEKTPELFERFLPYAIALASRTAGPTASPACWRPRASAPPCRPGTMATNSAPTGALSPSASATIFRARFHPHRRRRDRAAAAMRLRWRLERRRLVGRRRRRGRRVRLVTGTRRNSDPRYWVCVKIDFGIIPWMPLVPSTTCVTW